MINVPWNKIYLTSYLKENDILFPPQLNIGEDLKFNLAVIRDIQYVKVLNKALVNYTVKKGEGLVSQFRPNRLELRYSLLNDIKELLTYWGIILEHQTMIDRMLIRDIMAYFMDFFKKHCQYSYEKKLKIINEVIGRKEIKETITKSHYSDLSTKVIKGILKTNNDRFILLSAKILNIKRVLR